MYLQNKTYPKIYPNLWKDLELFETFQINEGGVMKFKKKKKKISSAVYFGFLILPFE